MNKISYRRHRFPAEIIQRAVWLCFRFPLSYRDVEDLLAERGVDVSYETIRRWALKFLLIRDTPSEEVYVLNMFRMRGSRL